MSLTDLVRGIGAGTGIGLDPVGFAVRNFDRAVTGAGLANRERAIPTLSGKFYEMVYPNPDDQVEFVSGVLPRAAGTVGGVAAGLGLGSLAGHALTGIFPGATVYAAGVLGTGVASVAVLAVPALLGLFAVGAGIYKYVKNSNRGERIGDNFEKGSFGGGVRKGWYDSTSVFAAHPFPAPIHALHHVESLFTGRDLENSYFQTGISRGASAVRRNPASLVGQVAGVGLGLGSMLGLAAGGLALGGAGLAAAGLFALPTYRLLKDMYFTVSGRQIGKLTPAYSVPA